MKQIATGLKRNFGQRMSDFLARGGSCSAITNQGLPCPIHGDRLVGGKWICHVHDPDGTCQKNIRLVTLGLGLERTPDVPGQMFFSDIVGSEADPPRSQPKRLHLVDAGAELFAPPSKEAARIAARRAGSFVKWSEGQNEH